MVELAWQILHCQIGQPLQRELLEQVVHHGLRQYANLGALQQNIVHVEDIVNDQLAQVADVEIEIMVECLFQTDGFDIETRFFFYENTSVAHVCGFSNQGAKIQKKDLLLQAFFMISHPFL